MARPAAALCLRLVLIAPVLLAAGGCHHAAAVPQGRSSFEILAPLQTAPPPGVGADPTTADLETVFAPGAYSPRDCPLPVYPARALAAGGGDRRVGVTVSFDEHGRPTDVTPNWRALSLEDPYTGDFLAAVKAAVLHWKIVPPHVVYYRRQPGGGREYLRTEALPDAEDLVFTFTASGQVKTGR